MTIYLYRGQRHAGFNAVCPDCRGQIPRTSFVLENGCRRCDGTGYIDLPNSQRFLPRRKRRIQRGYTGRYLPYHGRY